MPLVLYADEDLSSFVIFFSCLKLQLFNKKTYTKNLYK